MINYLSWVERKGCTWDIGHVGGMIELRVWSWPYVKERTNFRDWQRMDVFFSEQNSFDQLSYYLWLIEDKGYVWNIGSRANREIELRIHDSSIGLSNQKPVLTFGKSADTIDLDAVFQLAESLPKISKQD